MQVHPGPALPSCQSLGCLFHVLSACAMLNDDTSCAQVLELQLGGGHKRRHGACRNGWLATRLKSRGLKAETEKEISSLLNLSVVHYKPLGEYDFVCQSFVLIFFPNGLCWHIVPYITQA